MFGLGAGFDFGHQNETYFSVSQGYRPVRFFDVASPFSQRAIRAASPTRPSRCRGKRAFMGRRSRACSTTRACSGSTSRTASRRIIISPVESVLQNSGDTRHRGFEGELSYDFLAARADGLHLTAFGNVSLLDAKFTTSDLANRVGNTPGLRADADGKIRPHPAQGRPVQRQPDRHRASAANISRIRTCRSERRERQFRSCEGPCRHAAGLCGRLAADAATFGCSAGSQPHRPEILPPRLPERHRARARRKVYAGMALGL